MAVPAFVEDLEWTAERALALPDDGNRYEVLDGELFVTPAPSYRHQAVLAELFVPLRQYVHGLTVRPRAGPTSRRCCSSSRRSRRPRRAPTATASAQST